ncbi:MAG: MaoC family dehydratase [Proteobacteria bacterium]|nr:MaoC family dehydratase [Pseudomonadota bacterium]
MTDLYLEDFKPGDRFESRGRTVSEAEIIDFALRYDPQPIHIDAEAAKRSPYGGLIASGFHTMGMAFRLAWDTGVLSACGLGSPGIDEVRWLKPVRPGDTLRTVVEIVDARPSASKPDRGVCRFRYDVFNQNDEQVMTMTAVQIVARRPRAAAAS